MAACPVLTALNMHTPEPRSCSSHGLRQESQTALPDESGVRAAQERRDVEAAQRHTALAQQRTDSAFEEFGLSLEISLSVCEREMAEVRADARTLAAALMSAQAPQTQTLTSVLGEPGAPGAVHGRKTASRHLQHASSNENLAPAAPRHPGQARGDVGGRRIARTLADLADQDESAKRNQVPAMSPSALASQLAAKRSSLQARLLSAKSVR